MPVGLSHSCGQGRKTPQQAGNREMHQPHSGRTGSTWELISPGTTGQHPRIDLGPGRGSTAGVAVPWMLAPAIKSCHLCLCSISLKGQHPDGFGGSKLLKHLQRSAPQLPRDYCPLGQLLSTERCWLSTFRLPCITFHLAKWSTKPEGTGTSATGPKDTHIYAGPTQPPH